MYDSLKSKFGSWLAKLLTQIDGPIVLMGDFNRSVDSKSPRSNIRNLGYRGMREQAVISNEGVKEFPSKGWNLSDIYTIPSGPADVTGGEVDLTPSAASDHRRLEARITVTSV
jgi:endonuclease/exonuclease/phosphatase family metal-dependent hydrolase